MEQSGQAADADGRDAPFCSGCAQAGRAQVPVRACGSAYEPPGERRQLMGRTLEGLALSAADAFSLLLAWDEPYIRQAGMEPGAEMGYWAQAARFALELMLRGCIAPGTAPVPTNGTRRKSGEQALTAEWKPSLNQPQDAERFLLLAAAMPPVALGVPVLSGRDAMTKEEAGAFLLHSFMGAMIHAQVREVIRENESKFSRYHAEYRRGYSPVAELWWNSTLTASRMIPVQGSTEEMEELASAVGETGGP